MSKKSVDSGNMQDIYRHREEWSHSLYPMLFRVVAVILSTLALATIVFDIKRSISDTKKRPVIRTDTLSVLRSDNDGNFPLIGTQAERFYPPTITLVVPEPRKEWRKYWLYFRVNFHNMLACSYPIIVQEKNYNSFVSASDFEALKKKAVMSFRGFNYTCYFVREGRSDDKMGIFMYRDNFVVAPIKLDKGKDDTS
ncbi:MAG: hypothetical protein KAH23_02050 [Kiritimatiellae bacterium]|nr:hypothetical protein [Kiritimatiellia bacterium]